LSKKCRRGMQNS